MGLFGTILEKLGLGHAAAQAASPSQPAAPSQPASARHVLAWQLRDFAMSRHEQYGLAVQSVAHRNLDRHARLS